MRNKILRKTRLNMRIIAIEMMHPFNVHRLINRLFFALVYKTHKFLIDIISFWPDNVAKRIKLYNIFQPSGAPLRSC